MFRKETRLSEGAALITEPTETMSRSPRCCLATARRGGIVLVVVVVAVVIFVIVGFAVLSLAEQEIILTRIETDTTRAFYCAESGLAKLSENLHRPAGDNLDEILEESIEQGSYQVDLDTNQLPCYATSTGVSGTTQKQVRVEVSFLAAPFENAIYAMNVSGGSWALQLRGKGNPVVRGADNERGGRDIINGNIFVDGDGLFYEESSVNPAPAPNRWNLNGNVSATGNISLFDSARISGSANPNADEPDLVDLTAMDYEHNNTHDVAQIFRDARVNSGYLPAGNELRDMFVKNPSDRATECSLTSGDDYFLEPSRITSSGTYRDGVTPLNLGDDRVYYVDGDVWVHSKPTYGFKVDGKVTIVATGNIHICDNIEYKDANSLLGLVALGKYDGSGRLISGGNIFFGDPRYGTMYTVSALMFAANDFLFNADIVSRASAEPTTGFTINGCFAAMNQVLVERDWYTKSSTARAARYDSATNRWVDSRTGTPLTSTEINTLRHYQMIVNYDERVRSPETRPPGLPRGNGRIFAGFSNWEEL
jgi:hypothetical protein